MADLPGEAVGAAYECAAGDHSAADARSKRHHHKIVDATRYPCFPLRRSRTGAVVVDVNGGTQFAAEQRADFEVRDVHQVGSRPQYAGARHQPRHPNSYRVPRAHVTRQLGQRRNDRLRPSWRRATLLLCDVSGVIENHAETLGTTDVDAEASTHRHASARIFSSRTVLRMRTSARRLTKPGNGTTSSMARS